MLDFYYFYNKKHTKIELLKNDIIIYNQLTANRIPNIYNLLDILFTGRFYTKKLYLPIGFQLRIL